MKTKKLKRIEGVKLVNKNQKGITLIALVVTIVVLLILAGVGINAVFSENGIINRAQSAQGKMDKATQSDLDAIGSLNSVIDKHSDGSNDSGESEESGTQKISTQMLGTKFEVNTKLKDAYGNKITVPGGFKILAHNPSSATGAVTYTYSGDNVPAVQDGIVIENETDGNQFVWVPVGNIKNKNNTTTTITLGRYSDFTMTNGTVASGQPVQNADEYAQEKLITSTFKEVATADSSIQNTIARDLPTFISTTKANGGYYIARFESSGTADKMETKYNKEPLANLAQPAAATSARAMYGVVNDDKGQLMYASDLANSYAWDTAIIFIQTYSGESDYANQNKCSMIQNTGMNNDRYCNIWDMSGNFYEWTTESTTNPEYEDFPPCVDRGGSYSLSDSKTEYYTSFRYYDTIDSYQFDASRTILYVK